jgi:LmeA-like phospholipid-binding
VIKRLLILLGIFLIVVVVAVDRVGAIIAGQVLASKLKTDEHLAHRPDVTVGGFPFLTQALRGSYSDVKVTAHDVDVNNVNVTTIAVQLHGAHIGWKAAVHGTVHQVPVDRADGQVTISYADVNDYLQSRHLTVSRGAGGQVKVTGSLVIAGHTISASGLGTATVRPSVIVVHVRQVSAGIGTHVSHLSLAQRINFTLPLTGLPFHIALGSVHATAAGIVAVGSATHLVLGSAR